ncbi:unnamed protein product [Cochlearia groenlandica]
MIVVTHLSCVKGLEKFSGAKEMNTTEEEASTKHMVQQLRERVTASFISYEMQPCRGLIHNQPWRNVFNYLLIKDEPPNAPSPQRDKFLHTYRMESTNFLLLVHVIHCQGLISTPTYQRQHRPYCQLMK